MSSISWKHDWKPLSAIIVVFAAFYYLPLDSERLRGAVWEALYLTKWYAQEHVLLCLIPAFFIAGAIGVFVGQGSVMKYLGASANKVLSYGVASVSGSVLAVCSCTVLPLFAGIYRMGAGLGPATAFLYAGPAINVLAIILTARVLGVELGVARAVGAIGFSIIIGLLMHFFFRHEEQEKSIAQAKLPVDNAGRSLVKTASYFAVMVGILVFATWGKPEVEAGLWYEIYTLKWWITSALALGLAAMMIRWFKLKSWKIMAVIVAVATLSALFPETPLVAFAAAVVGLALITASSKGEGGEWFAQTWQFTKQIMPLLFAGVLVAGLLLGRPGHEGLIPGSWIDAAVGGNSIAANLFASVVGAFMYFATLTEIPILQGLIGNGMGKGPALALLLAGPALSLPNMLVISSIIGLRKTVVFVLLVVIMATVSGIIYGSI